MIKGARKTQFLHSHVEKSPETVHLYCFKKCSCPPNLNPQTLAEAKKANSNSNYEAESRDREEDALLYVSERRTCNACDRGE